MNDTTLIINQPTVIAYLKKMFTDAKTDKNRSQQNNYDDYDDYKQEDLLPRLETILKNKQTYHNGKEDLLFLCEIYGTIADKEISDAALINKLVHKKKLTVEAIEFLCCDCSTEENNNLYGQIGFHHKDIVNELKSNKSVLLGLI
jgi:hypothetical protein